MTQSQLINLLTQSDPEKSLDENSSSLINLYIAQDHNHGKYQTIGTYSPGLTVFATLLSPVRALYTEHGVVYAVGANKLYSISSNGTATILGTLNTSTGFAKIRGINDQLLIVDGTNGYVYKITAATFSTLASTTYVSSIVITAAGSGYSSTPTVTINDATGTGATAKATVSGGQITAITITANGSGYTSPTVAITDSAGTGATANAYTTTSSFNNNVQDIECQDEFGLAIQNNGQQWYSSDVSDLTTWPALSFASAAGNQNNIVAIISLQRQIWLLSQQTIEVWYNAGNAYFTWARRPDVYIEWGCVAKQSVVKGNNTIYFLGQSPTGGVQFIRMKGYTPEVISNEGINYQLSTYTTVSDAVGFIYQQEGHEFCVWSFPTANVTWVYDMTNETWTQRQSSGSRWLPNNFTYCYNLNLVGDYNSGNVYKLDMGSYQDNGSAITRTIVTHPIYQLGAYMICDRLQVDFDQTPGSNLSNVNLYVSRDGGNTFGSAKAAAPVQTAEGQWRCYWNRLGKARNFVFKISTTLNNKVIVLGAFGAFRATEY